MAIDSTAELLFNIVANSDDATENIARFRALMGQDLDGMADQFTDWSDEVFGKLETVKGAMIAVTASVAAGMLAVGMAVKESTADYQKYAEEIHQAAVLTGMHTEDLSALHSMAAKTGVDFGTLTQGLARFESNIVKAAQGSKVQVQAFAALGISQKDVIDGQKDLLPFLLKTMDGFHNMGSAVQKAAVERDLFGKGGVKLLEVLGQGSEGFREAVREIREYHLELGQKDVDAAHQFTVAQRGLKEQMEGIGVAIGKNVMPYLKELVAMLLASAPIMMSFAEGGAKGLTKAALGAITFKEAFHKAITEIEAESKKAMTEGVLNLIGPETVPNIKEAKQEFFGLATVVESMRSKIASQGSGWDRLREEAEHYRVEIDKATATLEKMHKAGTITPESYKAEQAALAQIPELLARVVQDTTARLSAADTQAWGEAIVKSLEAEDKLAEDERKAGDDRVEANREINDRMAEDEQQGYALQRGRLIQEMNAWASSLAKKTALTADNWNAIDKITAEGLAKIDRTEATGYQQEMVKLREHLDATVAANASAQDKLFLDEQKELEQWSKIEEQKALKTATTEAQIIQIQQMYAQIRTQIIQKYQNDLQALMNSQGFQGIFGNYFGNLIKQNQQLYQQWSQSVNQSLMLVKVSMAALKQQAQQSFGTMIQGMGQTMVQAFATSKSVSQAMEQMLASTLKSFAGQAMTAAIMSLGWGFYWMALQDYSAASNAFTAAAIFGTVGAAAAVAGKYMTPSNGAAGASGAGAGAGGGGGSASGGGYGGSGAGGNDGQQRPNVYVNIEGHVIGSSGAAQLCDIINQAVYGNDAQLYASHNPQGVPL